jgi:sec-independent protein translocase protein TatA
MPGWIGPWELLLLLFIVLIVFGPKRLPDMGRSLGRGMREFKNSISGDHSEDDPVVESSTTMEIAQPIHDDTDDLSALTKDHLYRRARDAGIPGRSAMSKDELVRALSDTSL